MIKKTQRSHRKSLIQDGFSSGLLRKQIAESADWPSKSKQSQ